MHNYHTSTNSFPLGNTTAPYFSHQPPRLLSDWGGWTPERCCWDIWKGSRSTTRAILIGSSTCTKDGGPTRLCPTRSSTRLFARPTGCRPAAPSLRVQRPVDGGDEQLHGEHGHDDDYISQTPAKHGALRQVSCYRRPGHYRRDVKHDRIFGGVDLPGHASRLCDPMAGRCLGRTGPVRTICLTPGSNLPALTADLQQCQNTSRPSSFPVGVNDKSFRWCIGGRGITMFNTIVTPNSHHLSIRGMPAGPFRGRVCVRPVLQRKQQSPGGGQRACWLTAASDSSRPRSTRNLVVAGDPKLAARSSLDSY